MFGGDSDEGVVESPPKVVRPTPVPVPTPMIPTPLIPRLVERKLSIGRSDFYEAYKQRVECADQRLLDLAANIEQDILETAILDVRYSSNPAARFISFNLQDTVRDAVDHAELFSQSSCNCYCYVGISTCPIWRFLREGQAVQGCSLAAHYPLWKAMNVIFMSSKVDCGKCESRIIKSFAEREAVTDLMCPSRRFLKNVSRGGEGSSGYGHMFVYLLTDRCMPEH